MRLLIILFFAIELLFVTPLEAQNSKEAIGFEIEADPFAYIFNGYSLHAAYTFSNFRTSVGVYGLETPDFFLSNDAFSVKTNGYDLKFDYLPGDTRGLFIGGQINYFHDKTNLKYTDEHKKNEGFGFGVRTGFRLMLGKVERGYKGLYIVPWIALIYSPSSENVEMLGEKLKGSSWTPFPTIHLGWRF